MDLILHHPQPLSCTVSGGHSTAVDRPRTKRILVFAIKHTCHFRLDGARVLFYWSCGDLHEYLWYHRGSYSMWGNYITRMDVSHGIFHYLMYKLAIVEQMWKKKRRASWINGVQMSLGKHNKGFARERTSHAWCCVFSFLRRIPICSWKKKNPKQSEKRDSVRCKRCVMTLSFWATWQG